MRAVQPTDPVQAVAQRGSWRVRRTAEVPRDARAWMHGALLVVMMVVTIALLANGLLDL